MAGGSGRKAKQASEKKWMLWERPGMIAIKCQQPRSVCTKGRVTAEGVRRWQSRAEWTPRHRGRKVDVGSLGFGSTLTHGVVGTALSLLGLSVMTYTTGTTAVGSQRVQ